MTERELLLQLMEKMDQLEEHYNNVTTIKLAEINIDILWLKWLIMFVVTAILAQAIIAIWNSCKVDKRNKVKDVEDIKRDKMWERWRDGTQEKSKGVKSRTIQKNCRK